MASYQFMSPDWLAMVEREFQAWLDRAGARASFSLSEHYLGDPPSGWTIELRNGVARLSPAPTRDADIIIECVREDAAVSAKLPNGPAYDEFRAWRLKHGRLRVETRREIPRNGLESVHDAVAAQTR
ncbi:MAG TPA: hypothetical protein VG943_12135 [Caulobacterales bacterium]|nr:hypothetical protein [Caulobacterales bacterium]